jgi:hypothetical protein
MYDQGAYPPPVAEKLAPPPVRKKGKLWLLLLIVLIVVVVGPGVFRYFGPTIVTKSFMDDGFGGNSSGAAGLLCPSEQRNSPISSEGSNPLNMKIDTSGLAYDIQGESLSNAIVHVHGSVSLAQTSANFDYTVALQANGVWWCVSQVTINSTS